MMKLINCLIVCVFSVTISIAEENSDEHTQHSLRELGGVSPDNYLPSRPNCGTSSVSHDAEMLPPSRTSKLGEWPWIGSIGYLKNGAWRNNTHYILWFCSCTLINQRYVVTAAHCTFVRDSKIAVVKLGSLRLDEKDTGDGSKPEIIKVDKIILYPDYTGKRPLDDVALLRLARNVTFSRVVQPICMPDYNEKMFADYILVFPYIAGWGHIGNFSQRSVVLRSTSVPVWFPPDFKTKFAKIGREIPYSAIVAGWYEGQKESCLGDAGGPLMYTKGRTTYLIGIESYGDKCAVKGYPTIFNRVSLYAGWFESAIREDTD